MKTHAWIVAGMAFLGGATASLVGTQLRGARADVPDVPERLSYSGVLVQGATPVSGSHKVRVRFFDAAVNGAAFTCAPRDAMVDLSRTAGRFEVNVSDCAIQLDSAKNAFVEVTLDPGAGEQVFPPIGTGRPRVGAVPYASQSLSATSAGTVPLSGVSPAPTAATAVEHVPSQPITGGIIEVAQMTFMAPANGVATFIASGNCDLGNNSNLTVGISNSATPCDGATGPCAASQTFVFAANAPTETAYALQSSFPVSSGANTFFVFAHNPINNSNCNADMRVVFSAGVLQSSSKK